MDEDRKIVPEGSVQSVQVESLAEHPSQHTIEAQSALSDRGLRALKDGDAFAVLDSYGDHGLVPDSPEGLFYRDTRYLSRFALRIEGRRPLLLSSNIQDDNAALSVDLTNPDIHIGNGAAIPRDILSINRTKLLWQGACYERIGLRNFDRDAHRFGLDLVFDADFRDLFEVRGTPRKQRGKSSAAIVAPDRAEFHYMGLDGTSRHTTLHFNPAPKILEAGRASFDITLGPDQRTSILVTVACDEAAQARPSNFLTAYRDTRRNIRATTTHIATVESSNNLFNEVACRSISDLYMLMTRTEAGLYPYAGIPWYSTVFGRDGIITAMLLLWVDPLVAKGVLRYLAAHQATSIDPTTDAQPGKILHERRQGEMAMLDEVPFRQYYGSVDATPLFVMLAGMYFERTGDIQTVTALWPNIEAALAWCDTYGDADGDGFVEYRRETEHGLANQGWKDSYDSIFHADGSSAEGPIALCEVQGYVFAAKRAAAELASALARPELAMRLAAEAEQLRGRFAKAFWREEIGSYALALDGHKQPCRVRTSNAGHALFTGIADPHHARLVARALCGNEAFSGWGIRTLAGGEPRYNPMSYHNGSIWPHDNALIALGFARYGLKDEAAQIAEAIFAAATYQESRRLPELFCGFIRRKHRGPTAYPVACSPQAWAAAAPFGLLAACLGLKLSHPKDEICFADPVLPGFLDEVVLRGLQLGGSRIDVRLNRHGKNVTVDILSREGDARIVLSK